MIMRKRAEELEKMRRAGRVVGETLQILQAAVKPGVTTQELTARSSMGSRGIAR